MKVKIIIFMISMFILTGIVGCQAEPEMEMNEVISEFRDSFAEEHDVDSVAATYDGEQEVKLRVIVDRKLNNKEAIQLFKEMEQSIVEYSSQESIWDDYEGRFDIVSYQTNHIYQAVKRNGEALQLVE